MTLLKQYSSCWLSCQRKEKEFVYHLITSEKLLFRLDRMSLYDSAYCSFLDLPCSVFFFKAKVEIRSIWLTLQSSIHLSVITKAHLSLPDFETRAEMPYHLSLSMQLRKSLQPRCGYVQYIKLLARCPMGHRLRFYETYYIITLYAMFDTKIILQYLDVKLTRVGGKSSGL